MTAFDERDQQYIDTLEQVIKDLRVSSWALQWFEQPTEYPDLFNHYYLPFLIQHPEVRNAPVSNETFFLPSREQFETMRQAWFQFPASDVRRYGLARNRCTDFAWNFRAFCQTFFGINSIAFIYDSGTALHSYNGVVIADMLDVGIQWFEPEGGTWVRLSDSGLYQLKRGEIIL